MDIFFLGLLNYSLHREGKRSFLFQLKFFCCLFASLTFYISLPQSCTAQEFSQRSLSALNYELGRGKSDTLKNYDKTTLPNLSVQTAEQVIRDRRSYEQFGTFYRSLVIMEDYLDFQILDQLEDDEDLAKSFFLYQSGKQLSKLAFDSSLGEQIKQTLSSLIRLRDFTTINLKQDNSGSYSLKNNRRTMFAGPPLAQFKLHLSTKRGIEPRLKILDNIMLSYDFIGSATLLEFELDF